MSRRGRRGALTPAPILVRLRVPSANQPVCVCVYVCVCMCVYVCVCVCMCVPQPSTMASQGGPIPCRWDDVSSAGSLKPLDKHLLPLLSSAGHRCPCPGQSRKLRALSGLSMSRSVKRMSDEYPALPSQEVSPPFS